MSIQLNNMMRAWDRRMAARRRMLDELAVDVADPRQPLDPDDLRTSLMACGFCRAPETCETWVGQGRRRLPERCAARGALQRLAVAARLLPAD